MGILTSAERQAYRESGAVVLRQVFSDWIDPLRAGVDDNMNNPGSYQRVYTKTGQPGRFWGDYCNWQRISQYHDFVFRSPAAMLATELMGSKTARFFHEHVLVKEPGTQEKTPWHHDQPYYCVDGHQVCSLWIPLDTVPRTTCPEFIAGSHRWGQWFLPRKFSGVDYDHRADHLNTVPDIDNHRDDYDILSWDLQPGDAIAFHFLTLHGAPANTSTTTRRRAFAARWLGDDATYAERPGEISPPFPGLGAKLKAGDPMDSEEFPLVWPDYNDNPSNPRVS